MKRCLILNIKGMNHKRAYENIKIEGLNKIVNITHIYNTDVQIITLATF